MSLLAWSVLEALLRNWALVAIVSTVVCLILVPALVILKYARISLKIMRTTNPPLARNPLDFERLVGEQVSFAAGDGLRLSGMMIRANPLVPRRGRARRSGKPGWWLPGFCPRRFSFPQFSHDAE